MSPGLPARLRRAESVLVHWAGARAVIENYATGGRCAGSDVALRILHAAARPRTLAGLRAVLGDVAAERIDEVLRALFEEGILLPATGRRTPDEERLRSWASWSPAAAYMHLSTKNVQFRRPGAPVPELYAGPRPAASKPPGPGARTRLPAFPRDGPLPRTLLDRRTWRDFGDRPLTVPELSTLLGLTWAVQSWSEREGTGPLAFKTAPSGGARHSIEGYVLLRSVAELAPGTYRYDPDEHALESVAPASTADEMETFLPAQPWFHGAAAVVFMTSVFERVQWRYRNPRAYRVVLLEAGHHAQTFCLLATHLGLAPFCTAALGDSAIERHLGIDGIGESVLYSVGVGPRPEHGDWSEIAGQEANPLRTWPPRHLNVEDPD